jgi:hypothetical protein
MDPRLLLMAFKRDGITIRSKEEDLSIESPRGELIEADREVLRSHKPALLTLLSVPDDQDVDQDLADWPIPWRAAWGHLTNELEDAFANEGLKHRYAICREFALQQLAWRRAIGQPPEQAYQAIRVELGLATSGFDESPWAQDRKPREPAMPRTSKSFGCTLMEGSTKHLGGHAWVHNRGARLQPGATED